MGIEWQTRCAPQWERTWERGRHELSQPNLFTQFAPKPEPTIRVRPYNDYGFEVGAKHVLRVENNSIVVFDGVTVAGVADSPSKAVVDKITTEGDAVAFGIVRQVFPYTKSVEIGVP